MTCRAPPQIDRVPLALARRRTRHLFCDFLLIPSPPERKQYVDPQQHQLRTAHWRNKTPRTHENDDATHERTTCNMNENKEANHRGPLQHRRHEPHQPLRSHRHHMDHTPNPNEQLWRPPPLHTNDPRRAQDGEEHDPS